jgi:hypothetical protein
MLHMMEKHAKEIERAHRQGKGYRFSDKKVLGGAISLKSVGRALKRGAQKAVDFGRKAMANPVVNRAVKDLGHIAVVASQRLANNGYDPSAYTAIAYTASRRGTKCESQVGATDCE